jgi:hypothetical protein
VENAPEHQHDRATSRGVSKASKNASSLPSEDAVVVLLFSLMASGQIRLRRIDGWQKIATVLRQPTPPSSLMIRSPRCVALIRI